jgi:hypothetical protein
MKRIVTTLLLLAIPTCLLSAQYPERRKPSGLFRVQQKGKWGYIEKSGKTVINPQYEEARNFSEGFANVEIGDRVFFINAKGVVALDPLVINPQSGIRTLRDFSNGLVLTEIGGIGPVFGKFGYMDQAGKLVIEAVYGLATTFSDGMALVQTGDPQTDIFNTRWGFIDQNGKVAGAIKYDFGRGFTEGLAAVKIEDRWGYIDKTGEMIIQPQFDNAWEFSEGLARVKLGDRYLFIDRTGQIVIRRNVKDVAVARVFGSQEQLVSENRRPRARHSPSTNFNYGGDTCRKKIVCSVSLFALLSGSPAERHRVWRFGKLPPRTHS